MSVSGITDNGTVSGVTINGDFDINTTDKVVIIKDGVATEDNTNN